MADTCADFPAILLSLQGKGGYTDLVWFECVCTCVSVCVSVCMLCWHGQHSAGQCPSSEHHMVTLWLPETPALGSSG
jgi:hypothetical protein